jgi:hypothetical protein
MPNTIVVFLHDYDTLITAVDAEVVPVGIIKEIIQFKNAKLFMKLFKGFSEDCYLLSLQVTLFYDIIHLEIFLFVLK